MAEIDSPLLRDAAGAKIGAVLVDDLIGAMKGSGEIIQSGLWEDQIWELGKMIRATGELSGSLNEEERHTLRHGLLVCRSIGVSMTDQAAAMMLKAKHLGTMIECF
jgi:ornithine cyclodeaminase/alanine dehydrogenase-like protein (mu-crystallin family)